MTTALLASVLMISGGCASTNKRLQQAAIQQGQARAAVILPDLPQACRDAIGGVNPKEGEKWRGVQLRWRVVRENENEIKAACAAFYDDLKTRLAKGEKQ